MSPPGSLVVVVEWQALLLLLLFLWYRYKVRPRLNTGRTCPLQLHPQPQRGVLPGQVPVQALEHAGQRLEGVGALPQQVVLGLEIRGAEGVVGGWGELGQCVGAPGVCAEGVWVWVGGGLVTVLLRGVFHCGLEAGVFSVEYVYRCDACYEDG